MITYEFCKKIIERGNYIEEDMLKKLDVFFLNNRITESQYQELKDMMQAKKEL